MTDIGPLQVERATSAEARKAYTGADGEPVVSTNEKQLYLHDGVTQGGLPAMGVENQRRLLSQTYAGGQEPEPVHVITDVGKWFDPDAAGGESDWSDKLGFTLTSQSQSTSPWEPFAKGAIPAGGLAEGGYVEVDIWAECVARSGSTPIFSRWGLVWDFDGTQVSQAAPNSGNWAVTANHEAESLEQGWLLQVRFRLTAMGHTEHIATIERARIYNASGVPQTAATAFLNLEGRAYRNTLDFSQDHTLYLVANWNGPVTQPDNDLRVRSCSAVVFGGGYGGIQPDLFGA